MYVRSRNPYVHWIIGSLVFLVVVFLVYNLRTILTPFIAAAILAYILNPLVNKLTRGKIGRGLAAMLVTLLAISVVVSLILFIIPMMVQQAAPSGASLDDQVALLEKSYEIAARYMNGGQAPEAPRQKASVSGKASVQPVRQVRRNIVSLLAAPLPDSVFAREFVKPRNWGFNTVGSDLREPERNSIRAAVQQTVTLTDGGEVTFRLLEPMMAGDLLIPSGTPVTGAARINGERLTVKVSAVQHGGAVVPVDLSVYDTNGNEGIPVPGSEELNAVKEIAANMGAGMGSSITITDDAGSQLLSDLGRSAIQGVSQYVSKKMRSVKVTLKAGYSVLLLPPLQ